MTATIACLEMTADTLAGVKVNPYFYGEPTARTVEPTPVMAFILSKWYDCEEDYPGYFPVSYHHTRKGAEVVAAYILDHNPADRIIIEHTEVEPWEMVSIQP